MNYLPELILLAIVAALLVALCCEHRARLAAERRADS